MSRLLAFSTLGCPGLPLRDVAVLARTTGWSAVELRAADDEPVHIGLSKEEREQARRTLTAGGAQPLGIASYVEVASGDVDDPRCVADAVAHAELARDLGCRFVRVLPGGGAWRPAPDPRADTRAIRRLRAIAGMLPDGIRILVETHDSHPRGADVARILDAVGHPAVGAIWDAVNPWRHGEEPDETAAVLKPWLADVQVKDCASTTELAPLHLGTGAVPLSDVLGALEKIGYTGSLSLEWEAKWYPQAAPLVEALRRGRQWLAQANPSGK